MLKVKVLLVKGEEVFTVFPSGSEEATPRKTRYVYSIHNCYSGLQVLMQLLHKQRCPTSNAP